MGREEKNKEGKTDLILLILVLLLVMPGCFGDHDNLKKELEEGTLKPEDLKACIARLVSVIWRSNQYEETK